ncbi:MAG: putative virulence factor [Fibromonadales bacterium]|nr:putative virulence factor [Fibromonadales bacterium]
MEKKIDTLLEIIGKSIKWVKETDSMKGAKGDSAYRKLMNFCRKLTRKKFALEGNPAAAMYGESQVGKSYLIGSLLSEQGKPFSITDVNGVIYNFIEKINPPGGGSESTSLVSRFSTKYKPINPKYPIKARLLLPADLVLMLCDSFYNDIKASYDKMLQREDIDNAAKELKNKWQGRSIQQSIFTEIDVLNIQEYFKDNFSTKAGNISDYFFEEISLLINKAQPSEWKEIFALLWNRNNDFTDLFSALIGEYQKLDFTDTLYLPIDAVLSEHTTLLDVICLKEIYERTKSDYKADTDVLYIENNREKEVQSFSKSYLCALSAELVFSLPETLLQNKLFLNETDLLDLPGIRARKTVPEDKINQTEIPDLLIRGKVAYLFNKYVEAEKINILLFCAKHEQASQRAMPELLNNYINKIIGETPESRENYIKDTELPPLFIVSTFFNMNMAFDPLHDKKDDASSLKYRWEQRFERTLAKEMLNTEIYKWFENWTVSQPSFQNIFLLRDFIYSESKSNLFRGFIETKEEKEEVPTPAYPNFRKDLKQSFIECDFVKSHFKNPENSWNRAASINEDGTKLIIDKLTIVANKINPARIKKIEQECVGITQNVLNLLNDYYNSPDKADSLLKAIRTAGTIQAKLATAFGKNPHFFGTMMREFMLNNSKVHKLYMDKINDIERRNVINMDKYNGHRLNTPELNPNDSFETNLERLCVRYEMRTLEECRDFFENKEGIDLNELFYGNAERVKNFSQVLADSLETYWFEQYMPENQQNLANIFSEEGLQSIQEMLRRLFKSLQISKIIADRIRGYVDGYRNIEEVYEMIADISTEIVNKFINSVGLEYYDVSNFNDLEKARENIKGTLVWEHDDLQFEQNNSEEVAGLITDMGNLAALLNQNPLPTKAKRLPNYRSYIIWSDLLKAGFVIANGVPNYDVYANERLRIIKEECEAING